MPTMNFAFRRTESKSIQRALSARNPGFIEAVSADARWNCAFRGERSEFRSRFDTICQVLRLCLASDAFLGTVLYRAKAAMQARGIPFLPRLAHRGAMMTAQIAIGDPVLMHPGIYIAHGQVVIDGITEVGPGCVVAPFVSIGLQAGNLNGPKIGRDVHIGTGSRVLGDLKIGDGAHVGANAVVTKDVEAETVVVGIPARPVVPKSAAVNGS